MTAATVTDPLTRLDWTVELTCDDDGCTRPPVARLIPSCGCRIALVCVVHVGIVLQWIANGDTIECLICHETITVRVVTI
jgi:hypothetical protein